MPLVSRPTPPEHPLLGNPRRDILTTAIVVAMTIALFVLVRLHGTRDAIQGLDDAFLRRMVSIRSGPLTLAAQVFNFLGLAVVTFPLRLVVAVYLGIRHRWWHVAAFVGAWVLSEASITLLKSAYDRPRPPHALALVGTSGSSFPSGHAVAASATALALVIALLPEGGPRFAWGFGAVVFSFGMAVSRSYLAAHWLSDAVAGTLLGASYALASAVVVHVARERWFGRKADLDAPSHDMSRARGGR